MIISYPFKRTHRSIIVCKLLTLRCMFTFLLNAPNQQSTSIIFFVFNSALSILNKLLGFLSFFFFLFFFFFGFEMFLFLLFISLRLDDDVSFQTNRWNCLWEKQMIIMERRIKSYSLVVLKVVCVAMLCLVH